MFCVQCGKPVEVDWKLCPFCRAALSAPAGGAGAPAEGDDARGRDIGTSTPAASPAAPAHSGFYRSSWAVLIGIDAYGGPGVPPLDFAVADVQAVAGALVEVGFDPERIITLTDHEATRTNIQKTLGGRMSRETEIEDRLLVFFSGHGQDHSDAQGNQMGYIIPIDGDPDELFASCISMDDVKRWNKVIPAKHILYVMDCCYSGLAASRSAGLSSKHADWLEKITSRPVRQIITAGRGDQKVYEENGQGVFTRELVSALRGDADLEGRGFVTGQELGIFLRDRVREASDDQQDPLFRYLSGDGEFILTHPGLSRPSAQRIAPPPPRPAAPPPPPRPVAPPPSPPRAPAEEVLQEEGITQFLNSLNREHPGTYVQPHVGLTPKVRRKLAKKFELPPGEVVVACQTDMSHTTGAVLGLSALYWRNADHSNLPGLGRLSWSELLPRRLGKPSDGFSGVDLGQDQVIYCISDEYEEELGCLIEGTRAYIQAGRAAEGAPAAEIELSLEEVVEVLSAFWRDKNFFLHPNIPQRKLNSAHSRYGVPHDEPIAALIDTTALGSAKTGLAFGTTAVYWFQDKNLGLSPGPQRVPYAQLPKSDIHLAEPSFAGVQITYKQFFNPAGSSVDSDILVRMLWNVRDLVLRSTP